MQTSWCPQQGGFPPQNCPTLGRCRNQRFPGRGLTLLVLSGSASRTPAGRALYEPWATSTFLALDPVLPRPEAGQEATEWIQEDPGPQGVLPSVGGAGPTPGAGPLSPPWLPFWGLGKKAPPFVGGPTQAS